MTIQNLITGGFSVTHCLLEDLPVVRGQIKLNSFGYGYNVVTNAPAYQNIRDVLGYSLLDHAVTRHRRGVPVHMHIVHMLISAGVPVDIQTLQAACTEMNVALLKMLTKCDSRMLAQVSNDGCTMLHRWALGTTAREDVSNIQFADTLQYLVAHDVKLDGIDEDGNTPLLIAAADRSDSMLLYIEMMERAPYAIDINHRNNHGLSALHLLVAPPVRRNKRDGTDTMEKRGNAMLMLFRHGALPDIGRGDVDRRTTLDIQRHVRQMRTPAQILRRLDIPPEERDPLIFPEEQGFQVLVDIFEAYLQRLHMSTRVPPPTLKRHRKPLRGR